MLTRAGRGRAPGLRRLGRICGRLLPVVLGVVVAVFFLLRIVPGDPARMILGDRATDASVAALRTQLGLDRPLWRQFADFVITLVTRFDTGDSLVYHQSTRTLILTRMPLSLGIVAIALLLTVLIAVPLAVMAAAHQGRVLDQIIRIIPTIGMGLPTFWVGLMLIVLFAVQLRWFPVGGVKPGIVGTLWSLFLPALAVALAAAPPLVRSLRQQLLEVMQADFLTTLAAARVPRRRILYRHVLRNAAPATLNLLGVNIASMIGGTLVVEKVFAVNGTGLLLFNAISSRDFPVVQGVALYCAIMVVIVTLAVDALAGWIDPRLRDADATRAGTADD